jgi:4-amino-4-deoxy-L-arabinose transferase-like glycosyltransferase
MAVSSPDTLDYLARADMILNGEGLPDPLRTPALPLLLAMFDTIGSDPVVSLAVFQNLLGMLVPAAVLLVGWRYFNPFAAVAAGFLTAASPLLMLTEQFALTDYLFGVLLFAASALLVEAVVRLSEDHPARRWLIAAGALFGLATLVRGNGQYALVAIPIALMLGLRDWRKMLRPAGITIAAGAVVVAPWVVHNIVNYGTPQVTTLGGEALYVRVIDHDRVPPPDDTPEGKLARTTYDKIYAFAPPGQELNSGLIFAGVLANEGNDNVTVSSTMAEIAVQAITENPSLYVTNTWNIFREYRALYDPANDPDRDHIQIVEENFAVLGHGSEARVEGRNVLPGDSGVTRLAWEGGQLANRLVYLLSFGGLLALALPFVGSPRSRIAAGVFLTMVILGYLVGALSEHFEPRYDLPYAYMTWLLMSAASVWLAQLVVRCLRLASERWPGDDD